MKSKLLISFLPLIVALLIVSLSPSTLAEVSPNTVTTASGASSQYGCWNKVLRTSDGTIHTILWQTGSVQHYYSYNDGASWSNLTVYSSAYDCAFDKDSNDNLVAVYRSASSVLFKKATVTKGSPWSWSWGSQKTVIASITDPGSDIVVDGNDYYHIVSRHSDAETRYFRSDTDSGFYKLLTTNTASSTYATNYAPGVDYLGIRVYKDDTTELTSGVPQARTRAAASKSIKSATWACPATAGVSYVTVYVYNCDSSGGSATLLAKFKTDSFNHDLEALTWTVYYSCDYVDDSTTFYFGDSTDNSRITSFNYYSPKWSRCIDGTGDSWTTTDLYLGLATSATIVKDSSNNLFVLAGTAGSSPLPSKGVKITYSAGPSWSVGTVYTVSHADCYSIVAGFLPNNTMITAYSITGLDLYFRKSASASDLSAWDGAVLIKSAIDHQWYSSLMIISNSQIRVYYCDGTDLCYKESTDSGGTFGSEVVAYSTGTDTYPVIARSIVGSKIDFIWTNSLPAIYHSYFLANNAPSNGAPSYSWDDTNNLYAQKRYYEVNVTYTDADGYADFDYVELRLLQGATTRAIFRYDEDTDTPSVESGTAQWELDTTASYFVESGNTIIVRWNIKAKWNATEESNVDVELYCVDASASSDTDDDTNIFDVVTRLVTSGFTSDDSRINISGTTTISGTVYYGNDPSSNTASTSYPPDAEFTSVNIHDASHASQGSDSTIVNGAFSVSFAIPSAVQTNTYHVYINMADAEYIDGDAVDGDTTQVCGDRGQVQSYTVADDRVNINENVNIDMLVYYDLDDTPITDGTVTINGYAASHQGSGVWRITRTSSSATSVTYNTVAISGNTYGISAIDQNGKSKTVTWESLTTFNIQTVEYLGSAQYRYKCQIKYASDSSVINGAFVNVSLPSGTIIGQLTSNSSGWIAFILTQTNASASGTYTIFGVNDNTYGITVAGANQTFTLKSWELNSKDTDGNDLSSTTLTVKKSSTTVYSGGDDTLRVPSDTFNITITWLSLTVNTTTNLAISVDTITNFACLAYPYTYESVRYWTASDATISSVSWNNNILTLQFSGAVSTYTLKASCTTKPVYVLNCTYDYDTAWTTILTLTHYANTTIKICYSNWGGTNVYKTDQRMTAVSWDGQKLSLTFTGTSGDTGTVEIYCGSRGNPSGTEGFTTSVYTASTATFTGYYAFSSDKTVSVTWDVSGPGGPGGTTTPVESLLISVLFAVNPTLKAGTETEGTLTVKWSGATVIYVYDVRFEQNGTWFTVEGLPLKLQKARDSVQGESAINVVVKIPAIAQQGDYSIPCIVVFRTEASQEVTVGATLDFTVESPPSTAEGWMLWIFLAVFGVIFLGALARGKKQRYP